MKVSPIKALTFLLLGLIMLQASCNPDDYGACEDDPFLTPDRAYLIVSFYQTGLVDEEKLLDIAEYPCNRDSVRVFDESINVAEEFEFQATGNIFFRVTYDDQLNDQALTSEVSRRFRLYINYQEVHWIELRYKLRSVKCSCDVFEYLEVYFDDILYSHSENVLSIPDLVIEVDSLAYNPCP